MPRLLFEKKGNAIWISHLDLMRVFQRAFKRAGLPLTHTQGFNPRPSVSIALPLSVGVSSCCELLDFELDGCDVSLQEIRSRLNDALVSGVQVLDVYEEGRKIRDLSLLHCRCVLEYDAGITESAVHGVHVAILGACEAGVLAVCQHGLVVSTLGNSNFNGILEVGDHIRTGTDSIFQLVDNVGVSILLADLLGHNGPPGTVSSEVVQALGAVLGELDDEHRSAGENIRALMTAIICTLL